MREHPRARSADSPAARPPTSHERRAGEPWDASYRDGPAPWDTGRPQPAVRRLASEGAFAGAVLDAGCGTGENALHLAAPGLDVLGVDADAGPGAPGPHPVSEAALRAAFAGSAWRVAAVDRDSLETTFSTDGAPAWLARIRRT
jgi:SAM-dependent methyltransferase